MQPVYQVEWDPDHVKFERRLGPGLCAWSQNNWVAFTTGCAFHFDESCHAFQSQMHSDLVFVIDPDCPWYVHPIKTGHASQILHLAWDPSNQLRLVTSDESGICKIWCSEDDCINKWRCLHTIDLGENDRIVKLCWLCSPNRNAIDLSQFSRTKDFLAKFPPKQSQACADQYLGCRDAFACVTSGGVFHVVSSIAATAPAITSVWLGNIRFHVAKADMMLTDTNKISIAVISDVTCVDLFIASLRVQSLKLEVTIDVWPCIVPYPVLDGGEAVEYCIKDVRYVLKGSGDQLLVVTEGVTGTSLHHFELKKEPIVLHSRFRKGQQSQQNQSADSCLCVKTINLPKVARLVALTQLPVISYNKGSDFSLSQKAFFVDNDSMLRVYSLQSWAQISKTSIAGAIGKDNLDSVAISPADQALFAITNSSKCILWCMQYFDVFQEKMRVQCVSSLLEYCMLEKQYAWDVVLYLKWQSKFVSDQAVSVLDDNFRELPSPLQDHYAVSFLQVKSLVLKASNDYVGFLECVYMVTLKNIYLFIIGLMQSEKDVLLLDSIQAFNATSKEFDITKAVLSFDAKEASFVDVADGANAALFQWVVDYVLHLVRLIRSGDPAHSLKQLLSYVPKSAFQEIRDVLVVMLVIFQKNPASFAIHPVYMSTVSMQDFLQQLYSFSTKLYCLLIGEPNVEFGHSDLVFSSLPLMYLPMPSRDPSGAVLSLNMLPQKSLDLFEFQMHQDDWDTLKQMSLQNPLTAGVLTVSTGPRHIYDGVNLMPCSLLVGEGVKMCCRCGAFTFSSAKASRVFNPGWRTCWAATCICGGNWKEVNWSDS